MAWPVPAVDQGKALQTSEPCLLLDPASPFLLWREKSEVHIYMQRTQLLQAHTESTCLATHVVGLLTGLGFSASGEKDKSRSQGRMPTHSKPARESFFPCQLYKEL